MGNEIGPIGRAATLGEWKQSHQNYVIDGYTPGDAEFGNWCARAKLETPLDGARLWVRTAYFYLPPAETLQRQVRESLTNRLGSGDANVHPQWFGSASWRNSVLWKSGGVSIVTAVIGERPIESGSPPSTKVFVAALGTAADLDFESFRIDDRSEIAQRRRIEQRIGDPNAAPADRDHTPVYGAIAQWLSASRSLPAPRRAAALFVADQLLSEEDVT
ncbi:MAG TPA: hypothetical protein VGK48_05085 [Terriglobia bacterium]|jgi:hypothetical protein